MDDSDVEMLLAAHEAGTGDQGDEDRWACLFVLLTLSKHTDLGLDRADDRHKGQTLKPDRLRR